MIQLRRASILVSLILFLVAAATVRAEIITSPLEARQFKALTLPNGLEAVVVSDPRADKTAVSLNVDVGSNANPEQRPGLAHFLEHMLFLGTEKYPEADSYQHFISSHGGSHNAFTAYEDTNYFFDVEASALPQAIDRFAQFFIAPLFTPEYVDRERHAVHSEYQAKLRDDGRRMHEVAKQVMNPEHHYSRFMVGSLDTLSDADDSTIRDELIRFYERYYSANLMTLAVVGPQPVEELETLVRSHFSSIENRAATPYTDTVPLYPDDRLPAQLNIQTLRETRTLSLSFPVPATRSHWEQKPLYYIGSLIGYEGEGSLLEFFKQKGLARGLSAYPAMDLPGQAMFRIDIELTEAGWDEIDAITSWTFSFIETLRQQGVDPALYNEERKLAEIQFRFAQPGQPTHTAMRLSQALKRYPTEYLLKADYHLGEFDAQLIQAYLNRLTPDNLLLTLAGQDVQTDQIEPRYETAYSLTPIQPSRLLYWQHPPVEAALHVRASNPFIPEQLELVESEPMETPIAAWAKPGAVLWYLSDQTFKRPKADFYFTLLSPVANQSPRHALLAELYTRMVKDQLNTTLYDASLAGLSVDLYPHLRGISLKLSGFSDRQPVLLTAVLEAMKSPDMNTRRFARIKRQLREQIENSRQDKPYEQGFSHLYQHLLGTWSTEQKLSALEDLTLDDLAGSYHQWLKPAELRLFAHGNLSRETATAMAAQTREQLQPDVMGWQAEKPHILTLPTGEPLIDSFATQHSDASALLYLQTPNDSLRTRAGVALLSEMLSTPFYSTLRTEKQYGYIVFARFMPVRERAGLALVVQSPSTDPYTLAYEYNSFLERMSGMIAEMDDAMLERYRQSLLARINQRDTSLTDRTNRLWRELDRDNIEFDTRARLSEAAQQVDRDELLSLLDKLLSRQLLIRSFGETVEAEVKEQALSDDDARLAQLKRDQLGIPAQ
ncbi:insulinase family protein [Marinobacterium sp. AK62]|uniref:Protease 3 n=1 Tax=Marinobacterium alkalitolerans TaxID=1542925 RepID=A0ABS3ZCP5_9GAMM|nr:insulinase family protein [Marinobacterium alkalitolerans]MBP0049095.1 insulinase family protein [Marinobacterium alkalitolerans]